MQQPAPPDLPPIKPMATPMPAASPDHAPLQASGPSYGPSSGNPRPAAMGMRRLRQAVTAVAGGGFALVLIICGGELVLREGLRPTDWMATIEARTELGIFNQKMGAEPGVLKMTEADYQKALAKAQREGQAQADLDFQKKLMVVQADKERVVSAYQTLYQRANIIAQAAIQMESVAQQFRQQLLTMSNGGRSAVIMLKDFACGFGMEEACLAARDDRRVMIGEADALTRGDVGNRVRELMAGIDDPASFVAREDRRRNGTPRLERR